MSAATNAVGGAVQWNAPVNQPRVEYPVGRSRCPDETQYSTFRVLCVSRIHGIDLWSRWLGLGIARVAGVISGEVGAARAALIRGDSALIASFCHLAFGRARLGLPGGQNDLYRFLALFAGAYVVAISIMRWPSPAWNDMLEAWAWGSRLQLGYHKHPPFYSWVTYAWFQIFPRADWAFYLLSMTNVVVGLLGVWQLSGLFALASPARVLSVALLTVTPPYNLMASNYGADTALLSIWPWAAYAFVRSISERSTRHAVLFGALSAVALLSKYYSIVLLASCFAAALLHPARDAYFTWYGPYLSIAVCTVLCLPHVWWALGEGAPTVQYALERMRAGRGWPYRAFQGLAVGAASVVVLAVPIAALVFALGRRRVSYILQAPRRAFRNVPLWLYALALGPGVLTVLLSLVGVATIILNFFIPNYFLLPLVIMLGIGGLFTTRRAQTAMLPAVVFPVLAILTAPVIAYGTVALHIKETGDVTADVARLARDIWHREVGGPVHIIGGSKSYALAGAFYLPEAPKFLSNFSLHESPWISKRQIRRDGMLVICERLDSRCPADARALTKQSPKVFKASAQRSFVGARGERHDVTILVIPPTD